MNKFGLELFTKHLFFVYATSNIVLKYSKLLIQCDDFLDQTTFLMHYYEIFCQADNRHAR